MKKTLKYLLIIPASGLLLTGCCTMRQAPEWEYKVGFPNSTTPANDPKAQEAYLNDQAKSGWLFIERDTYGLFYFKREKR